VRSGPIEVRSGSITVSSHCPRIAAGPLGYAPDVPRRWLIAVAALAVVAAACGAVPLSGDPGTGRPGATALPTSAPATSSAPTTDPACNLPPLEVRVAQLLLVGFPGTEPTASSLAMARAGVGGLLLLGPNVASGDQVAALVAALQAEAPLPLIVAIDEEPGRIGRLARAGIIDGSPTARDLGRREPEAVAQVAGRIARDLAGLGITMNLAPVLDVTGAAAGGVIGDRSFGSRPDVVTTAGRAFIAGTVEAGVTPVAKHFPGHGETTVDSHTSLPRIGASRAALRKRALPPFAAAIEDGVPAVMLGHLLAPALDPKRPATLSRPIIEGLLRDELGFDGVAVADDLAMGALDRWGDLPRRTELAVAAGIDLAIVLDDRAVPDVIAGLLEAVEAGRLPESRVDEAFLRIARLKGLPGYEGCAAP
jgi:beta-N-acetylhexosaminidase